MRAWTLPGERAEVRYFSPKVPKSQPAPTPPTDTTAIQEAEARARLEAKQRRGRSATILTSPTTSKLGQSGTPSGSTQRTLGVK